MLSIVLSKIKPMSLIPQEKIEQKIIELKETYRKEGGYMEYDVDMIVSRFKDWYNEQLIEEIKKMKHNPAKDTHEIGMNQGFTDMICKLKDQSLSD